MARRNATRTLTDAFTRTRSPVAKPASVSLIKGGIKYKSGVTPARVCPAGHRLARTLAAKV